MFYVTSIDGSQVEPLINIGDDFKWEESTDGTLLVSFSCFPSRKNIGYPLLLPESVITIDGYDFKVKEYSNEGYKFVTAINVFYEHIKTQVLGLFEGSHTLNNHLAFVLSRIGWTYTVDPTIAQLAHYIESLGNTNVIACINKICKYHDCEYVILPDKRIHFAKQVGPTDTQPFKYKYNVLDVVLKENTTDLYTFIRGYGADDLEVSYLSPNHTIFGILEADSIRDDRFTDAASLTNYIKKSIKDTPEIAIESKIPELTNRSIGEKVWYIYEPLGIEMETRILKQTKVLINGKLVTESVVFGNTLMKSDIDLLVEQQEQLNDTKDYINESKDEINENIDNTVREINYKFQETDEKIVDQYTTITSEYSASITANARQIRTEMSEHVTTINNSIGAQYNRITEEYNSSISQTAREIRTDVTASINSVNNSIQDVQNYASSISQTAQQIQSQVSSQQTVINSQGTRISSAESSITQQANQIAQKVSQTDYNGITIASLINQTAYDVSISASKINLNGAVIVNGTISGASSINVSESATIGTTLQIGQDWQASYPKAIRFAGQYSSAGISYSGGTLTISAVDSINLDADNINILGNLSGSINAASVGGYTMSYSTSGGKKYITFRQYGTYLGQVEIA